MAYLAVDKDGRENIYDLTPVRDYKVNRWDILTEHCYSIELPKGTIAKIIGKNLTWEDGPVELTSQITDLW